jgi:hypothetical protein
MITEIHVGKAFHVALLLTGSIEAAERAVSDSIATSGCGVTGDQLLIATAQDLIQLRDQFLPRAEALSSLPIELQRLFLLSTVCRYSFVLRMLLGLTVETSSKILNLRGDEIDEALCLALNDLSCLARTGSAGAHITQAAGRVESPARPSAV